MRAWSPQPAPYRRRCPTPCSCTGRRREGTRLFETGNRLVGYSHYGNTHLLLLKSADRIEDLKQRRYYQIFEEKARQSQQEWSVPLQLASPDAIHAASDTSLSAWSFATALGISYDALPCIVTTTDLLAPEIEVLHTGAGTLIKQLSELGKGETRRSRLIQLTCEQQLGLFPAAAASKSVDLTLVRLARSLASTLSTALSGTYASGHGLNHGPVNAVEYRKQFLRALAGLVNDLRATRGQLDVDGELPEEFQQLSLSIAGVLQALAAPEHKTSSRRLADPAEVFEPETRITLKTAMRCIDVLRAPPWLEWRKLLTGSGFSDVADNMHESDFTPGLICLAKAFENEVNVSVVHWIRQQLGISLPEHFKKFQRGVVARYVPKSVQDGRPIDFNQSRSGKWLPPGLGQSELACKELVGECPPRPFNGEGWQRFLQSWRVIRQLRNDAAHPNLVGLRECERVVAEMTDLIDAGVFHATDELRRLLRGDRSTEG